MNAFCMLAGIACLVCVVTATGPITSGYGYQSYTPVVMATGAGSGFGFGGGSGFGGMGMGGGLFDIIFFLFFFMFIINLLGFGGKSSGLNLGNLGGGDY